MACQPFRGNLSKTNGFILPPTALSAKERKK
jgi:hypothetical protein